MKKMKRRKAGLLRHLYVALLRLLRLVVVIMGAYLIQVCVMPYFSFNSISPNLLLAVCAVLSVCYGKLRTFWAGGIYGALMETFLPTLRMFNLLVYPIVTTFSAVFFCDKSDKALEEARSLNKKAKNGNVYLRTVLCALVSSLLMNIANMVYIYLGGTEIGGMQIRRALTSILLTAFLTALIVYPTRRILGFHHPKKEEPQVTGRYLNRIDS